MSLGNRKQTTLCTFYDVTHNMGNAQVTVCFKRIASLWRQVTVAVLE